MKKLSKTFNNGGSTISAKAVGNLTKDELEKYLNANKNILSKHTKQIIDYLINNGINKLANNTTSNNPLLDFYMNNGSSNSSLYNNLKALDEIGRLKEVPVFMTRDEFNNVINGDVALDTIVLDLSSDQIRNKIAKSYTPLVHKLAKQWYGKMNYDYDELISIGYKGLVYAMNTYGKKGNKSKADEESIKKYSFIQYAAYCIRNSILNSAGDSHVVKLTKSDMKKEKDTKGFNAKSHSISGDRVVGKNGDDGNKTIFDFIDAGEDADKNMDMQDLQKLWKEVYDELEKHFSQQTMDIWYSFNGLNGYEKIKNKDLCAKYNMIASNITYYVHQVNAYIKKHLMNKMLNIYELMKECLNDWDRMEDDEPKHISLVNENTYLND